MNPKEVSYSHPQLPLCDTPIGNKSSRLPDLSRKSTAFLQKRKRIVEKICARNSPQVAKVTLTSSYRKL